MPKSVIKVDMDELLEFEDQFDQMVENLEQGIRDIVRRVALEYRQSLYDRTPVDTGRLRFAWITDNIVINVENEGDVYRVDLINNTEYASWVEQGYWSRNQYGGPYGWVMGQFYVRKTEHLWKARKLDTEVEKQITRWIKDCVEGFE